MTLELWQLQFKNPRQLEPTEQEPKIIEQFEQDRDKYCLRTMSFQEFQGNLRAWCQQEAWPATRHSAQASFFNDPLGFYFLEKNQEKVASIGISAYSQLKRATIGFYIVRPNLRGLGLGQQLLEKTLAYNQKQRGVDCFTLNCVAELSPFYEKFGFKTLCIDQIFLASKLACSQQDIPGLAIDYETEEFQQLANYDGAIFGQTRKDFLWRFISKPGTSTVLLMEDGDIKAYGIISEFDAPKCPDENCYRIGPVYADKAKHADLILRALLNNIEVDGKVFLETSGINPATQEIVENLDFKVVLSMPKMFLGGSLENINPKTFCYSSLAIGG